MSNTVSVTSLLAATVLLSVLLLGTSPRAHACIGDQYASIHFNSGSPDFGTPPRRASISWRGEYFNRPIHAHYSGDDYYEKERGYFVELSHEKDEWLEAKRIQKRDAFDNRASQAITAGQWQRARRLYEQEGKSLGWSGNLRDRVEVLTISEKPAALRQYLAALNHLDREEYADALLQFDRLASDTTIPVTLRGHAQYQAAWASYTVTGREEALKRYLTLSQTYPNVKREATLLMVARMALLAKDSAQQHPDTAAKAIHQLLAELAHSRFRHAALGVRARIDYLQGHYDNAIPIYFALGDLSSIRWIRKKMAPGATRDHLDARLLDAYLRQLGTTRRYETYVGTITDIDVMMRYLNPAGARLFVDRILADPDLATAYFYYRLYHCDNKPKDLEHLADLADRIAAHRESDATRFPRSLQVRLAEVYYQNEDYSRALPWANRALQGADNAPGRDRALYVRGAIRMQQKRYRAARADFDALLASYPNSDLRAAAREEMALEAEAVGDLADTLQQYMYLNYKPDIAYLLDARMTSADIARFLSDYPAHPQKHLILYSLGIRYMREERFAEAQRCFRRLPHRVYTALNQERHEKGSEYGPDTGSADPLTVLRDLIKLQAAVDNARRDSTRASALFRYASYYYTHGTLLLYNGALWQNTREENFDFYWNDSHKVAEDNDATHRHMYSHEVYARTQKICLMIARRYPDTPTAPPALYRAACCASKLGNFNFWWRKDHPDHLKEASRLMKQFVRRYPKHSLAPHARKYANVFYEESLSPYR